MRPKTIHVIRDGKSLCGKGTIGYDEKEFKKQLQKLSLFGGQCKKCEAQLLKK